SSSRRGKQVVKVNDTVFELGVRQDPAGQWVIESDRKIVCVSASVSGQVVSIRGALGSHDFTRTPYLRADSADNVREGIAVAPMMGTIIKVAVTEGDMVSKGDLLVVEE